MIAHFSKDGVYYIPWEVKMEENEQRMKFQTAVITLPSRSIFLFHYW